MIVQIRGSHKPCICACDVLRSNVIVLFIRKIDVNDYSRGRRGTQISIVIMQLIKDLVRSIDPSVNMRVCRSNKSTISVSCLVGSHFGHFVSQYFPPVTRSLSQSVGGWVGRSATRYVVKH